jgi:hypothetical protein
MMKPETYMDLKARVIDAGYAKEVDWSDSIMPCTSASKFLDEYVWVVLNAGMKEQVARKIFERIQNAIQAGIPLLEVFGHKGKVAAIERMLKCYHEEFKLFQKAKDKLKRLESLPWIGKVTKYHLAKNLGIRVMKPDRHLVRIAEQYDTTCTELCLSLAAATGDKLVTVDTVIWRAANLGFI